MRSFVTAVVVLALSTGCIGRTRETRPAAYAVNAVLVTAGVAAVTYGVVRMSSEPKTVEEAVARLASLETPNILLMSAGMLAALAGGVGLAGTVYSQSREDEQVRRALEDAQRAEAPPPGPVAPPSPETDRLAVQARLLAGAGHCDAALALDGRIRASDPVWHRAVFARDERITACRAR